MATPAIIGMAAAIGKQVPYVSGQVTFTQALHKQQEYLEQKVLIEDDLRASTERKMEQYYKTLTAKVVEEKRRCC